MRFIAFWHRRCLIVGCLVAGFGCIAPLRSQTTTPDEVAIEALLEAETREFATQPLSKVVKKFWRLDEASLHCVSFFNGGLLYRRMQALLESNKVRFSELVEITKSEHSIHVHGEVAFASHEQILFFPKTKKTIYSHELRVLRKVDSTWKIHIVSVHQYSR
jgi:hypothetical protein